MVFLLTVILIFSITSQEISVKWDVKPKLNQFEHHSSMYTARSNFGLGTDKAGSEVVRID